MDQSSRCRCSRQLYQHHAHERRGLQRESARPVEAKQLAPSCRLHDGVEGGPVLGGDDERGLRAHDLQRSLAPLPRKEGPERGVPRGAELPRARERGAVERPVERGAALHHEHPRRRRADGVIEHPLLQRRQRKGRLDRRGGHACAPVSSPNSSSSSANSAALAVAARMVVAVSTLAATCRELGDGRDG